MRCEIAASLLHSPSILFLDTQGKSANVFSFTDFADTVFYPKY